jgi:Na+/melibiose symporter-like transporter
MSKEANSTKPSNNSKENPNIIQIVIYALLYLLFIFVAQIWISTFIGYYRKYIVKKEELEPEDFLVMSLIFTSIFIFAVYIIRPTLPLFK